MLRILAESEKGFKDRLMPMAPEFAELLLSVPANRHHGFVFNPKPVRSSHASYRVAEHHAGVVISEIGQAANVKVDHSSDGKAKFASAHDLRRSFGTRWASRVMPVVLKDLMRHASIDTTLKYYVGSNAQTTAAILWEAAQKSPEASRGVNSGESRHSGESQQVVSPCY